MEKTMEDLMKERSQQMQAALLASQRSRLRREAESSSSPLPTERIESSSSSPNVKRESYASDYSQSAQPLSIPDLSFSLLECNSLSLRKTVGDCLGDLVSNKTEEDATSKTSKQDLEALIQLMKSSNSSLQRIATEWVSKHAEELHRGKMGINEVLKRTTSILTQAMDEFNPKAIKFALLVGFAIASEGKTWAERMYTQDNWGEKLATLLLESELSLELKRTTLHVCAHLAKTSSSSIFLPGCVNCVRWYPDDEEVLTQVCETLSQNLPPIEDEKVIQLFLEQASNLTERSDSYDLVSMALRVIRAKSKIQAEIITQNFEEYDTMNTLNALYRSQTFSSKAECALFLESLIIHLGDNVDAKVRLCETGALVRLIRLASPSSGTVEDGHELAYLPAITAITELAKVERIGARIVLAGGLGPLFSHANSSRPTRAQAKKALKALGVSNLGAVVEAWIMTAKSQQEEGVETPLESISLYDGSKLLWDSPPPKFFTDIVNNPEAVLGRGGFSVVYKATLSNGRMVAVKRLTKAAAADPGFSEEIRVLARVPSHPNIIGLLGVYLNDTECLIISELGGPTLSSVLATRQKGFPWRDRIRILIGIANAMHHLHALDPSILHLDLKASNVLLVGEEEVPKLCDFGLAVELKRGFEFLLPGEHGTVQYMAPEVIREDDVELGKGFDSAADVYSFSMVMWEVAHPGRIPWQGEHFDELSEEVDITKAIRNAVLTGRRPECLNTKTWPTGYLELMQNCWNKYSAERPRFVGDFFEESISSSMRSKPTIGHVLKRMLWERNSVRF